MAGNVTASGFSGALSPLNATTPINATHGDLVRSLLTVGYRSRYAAVRKVGPWRARMLHAMATGFLDHSLRTTQYFRNLEQSEKVGVTFLLGEAFTHWYAQDRMKVKHVLHVQSLSSYRLSPLSSPLHLKPGSAIPALKSRPDFIGIDGLKTHVFESKGRQKTPTPDAVSKALGQVSKIQRINGRKPITRCATFFMLKANGVEGKVVDPPASDKAVNISFDILEALSTSYSMFLDLGPELSARNIGDQHYAGVELTDGMFFGVDKAVLGPLLQSPDTAAARRNRAAEVSEILDGKADIYASLRAPSTSPGPDGTILIAPPRPRLRKRGAIPMAG